MMKPSSLTNALLLTACSALACQVDLAVPAGARLTCGNKSDCPESMLCAPAGFCVPADQIDFGAPDLASAPEVQPAIGKEGTQFTIKLKVTEPLREPPGVLLQLSAPVALVCVDEGGATEFACTYLATGDEHEKLGGVVPFDVSLKDASFNVSTRRLAGVLSLDFTAPVAAARSVAPRSAALGRTLEVFFTASEPLREPPRLQIDPPLDSDGSPLSEATPKLEPGTLNYRFTHPVGPGDAQGEVRFTAILTDRAGNSSGELELGRVNIDNDPPAVSDVSLSPEPPLLVTPVDSVTVSFRVSERLAVAPPRVRLDAQNLDCGPAMEVAPEPSFRFSCTLPGSSGRDGTRSVVTELSDEAGNIAVVHLGDLVFDSTPPSFVGGSVGLGVDGRIDLRRAGCAAVYALDETEGVAASELVAPQRNLAALTGAATWVPGRFGRALDLDGLSGAAIASSPEGLPQAQAARTLAVWVWPRSLSSGTGAGAVNAALSFGVAACPGQGALLGMDATGHAASGAYCNDLTDPGPALPLRTWSHLAETWDGSARTLYVNGVAVATDNPSGLDLQPGSLRLGSNGAGGFFDGRIDDARVYARALASDEVSALASEGPASSPCRYAAPLGSAAAVGAGGVVRVSFSVTEPLAVNPYVFATARSDGEVLRFQLVGASGASYLYEHVLSGIAHAQGIYDLAFEAVDFAGLEGSGELGRFEVDTLAPAPPDTATPDRIVYERNSFGTDSTAGLVQFTVGGADGAAEPGGRLFAFDRGNPTGAALLGSGEVSASGAFGAFDLGRTDHKLLHVATSDAAGNLSATADVRNVTVTATLGKKVVGSDLENPLSFSTTACVSRSLEQDPLLTQQADPQPLTRQGDGSASSAAAGPVWRLLPSLGWSPPARSRHALAYDRTRGRLVLFGGDGALSDTWEWDGGAWENRSPAVNGPRALHDHAMAYDSRRGVVVAYGGFAYHDTFEWDGRVWTQPRPSTDPGLRWDHAMAYDSRRGRVVLYGGRRSGSAPPLDDTWEWDGQSWTQLAVTGPGPLEKHALSFDEVRGEIVLYGGKPADPAQVQQTWVFDGTAWSLAATAGPPAGSTGRDSPSLAYDAQRDRTVLFGGDVGGSAGSGRLGDTWEWNGGARIWEQVCTTALCSSTAPSRRFNHASAWDSVRRRVVVFGGDPHNTWGTGIRDLWEWDGTLWLERTPAEVSSPAPRRGGGMVFDTLRQKLLLVGGEAMAAGGATTSFKETWVGNEGRWVQRCGPDPLCPTQPSERVHPAMAYDEERGVSVLFGGLICSSGAGCGPLRDTWEWNGTSWTERCGGSCATRPPEGPGSMAYAGAGQVAFCPSGSNPPLWLWNGTAWRSVPLATCGDGGPMAWDAGRGVVVRYDALNRKTWEYSVAGGVWVQKCGSPCTPSKHFGTSLAYDSARGRVVLFGGYEDASNLFDDAWEWDGQQWSLLQPAGSVPSPRSGHHLAFDSAHGGLLLFGGNFAGDQGTFFNDTWQLSVQPEQRAAELISIPYSALVGEPAQAIRSLRVAAVAGGAGAALAVPGAGAAVSGAGIWGWRALEGSWRLLGTNGAPTASPALASVTLVGPEAQDYILGDRLLSLLLAPVAPVGNNLAVAAEVKVDYLEATVSYERGLGRLWDFEKAGDLEGWTARNVATPGTPSGGTWSFATTVLAPQLTSPDFRLDAGRYRTVRVRLQSSGPGEARLFWRRNDTATELGQVQAFAVATGAAMQTYTLDLSEHPEWKGTITGLRLDPNDGGAGSADIDWIRVSR